MQPVKSSITQNGTSAIRLLKRVLQSAFWKSIFAVFLGFIMSRSVAFSGYAPFGVAAAAAFTGTGSLFAGLGAIIGYLLPAGSTYGLKYIVAIVLVLGFQFILSARGVYHNRRILAPILSASSILIAGGIVLFAKGFDIYSILALAAETLLCGTICYFFQKAIPCLRNPGALVGVTTQELASLVITLGLAAAAFCRLQIGGYSPGRIVVVLCILFAARYGRVTAGSVTGIICGIALALSTPGMEHLPAGYALGGLFAGLFSPIGRIGTAAAFLFANGISACYYGAASTVLASLYEISLAILLFILLPEKIGKKAADLFSLNHAAHATAGLRESVCTRLYTMKDSLNEVSRCIREVSSRLDKIDRSDISNIYTDASNTVCMHCNKKMTCWGEQYHDTMNIMNGVTEVLKKNGRAGRDAFPSYFADKCSKFPQFVNEVNHNYTRYTAKDGDHQKIAEMRDLMADQFVGLSEVFSELTEDYSHGELADHNLEERVSSLLAEEMLEPEYVACVVDKYDRMRIETVVTADQNLKVSKKRLLSRFFSISGRRFGAPEIRMTDEGYHMTFREEPSFTADFSITCLPREGNTLSGDTSQCFIDQSGHAIAIISDGMGSGGRAAVESTMAVSLLARLIQTGFSYDNALKIVNSALMVKSGDESLATVDMLSINLFNGQSQLLKAGAPATFLKRRSEVCPISFASMPVGILSCAKFEKSSLRVEAGDFIIMVSDGAVTGDDDWLTHELEKWDGDSPKAFSEHLAARAKAHRDYGEEDDITVMITKIETAAAKQKLHAIQKQSVK